MRRGLRKFGRAVVVLVEVPAHAVAVVVAKAEVGAVRIRAGKI